MVKIMGVSDEQLAALNRGRWEDAGVSKSKPAWQRLVASEEDDGRGTHQWVTTGFFSPDKWQATSGGVKEDAWFDSLDDALKWCDDKAGGNKILVSYKPATRQEDRFVWLTANI